MFNRNFVWLFIGSSIIVWLNCCISSFSIYENINNSYYSRIAVAVAKTGIYLPSKNTSVADSLIQKIRVLCWVTTYPKNHWKAMIVKNTWGQRCNILLFMSTKKDTMLPTVKLNASEGFMFLWGKTKEALKYIYKNHREDADWFLKADDDTYVILENLRFHLSHFQTESELFFGSHIISHKGYMDGGAGYVLSRATLDNFINEALPRCVKSEMGMEDLEISRCLSYTDVKMVNTRDTFGRSRFLPFELITHIHGEKGKKKDDNTNWYWKYSLYSEEPKRTIKDITVLLSKDEKKGVALDQLEYNKIGLNCCSDYTISIHRVPPHKMIELEYFIYQLRPYGITHRFE